MLTRSRAINVVLMSAMLASGSAAHAATTAYSGAKLVALIAADGTIQRQKAVASVTNPSAGVYCILSSSSALLAKITEIVPVASPEYNYSPDYSIGVQWDSAAVGCPTNTIAINTFNYAAGANVPANEAFSILVQ